MPMPALLTSASRPPAGMHRARRARCSTRAAAAQSARRRSPRAAAAITRPRQGPRPRGARRRLDRVPREHASSRMLPGATCRRAADSGRRAGDQGQRHLLDVTRHPVRRRSRHGAISGRLGCAAMVSRVSMPSPAGRSWIGRARPLCCSRACSPAAARRCKSERGGRAPATITPTSAENADKLPATVLDTLGNVLARVYREGVFSERTASARDLIAHSRRAARSGRNRQRGGRARGRTGAARDRAHDEPARDARRTDAGRRRRRRRSRRCTGTLTGASGAPIASYITSVWADSGFIRSRLAGSPRAWSTCARTGTASAAPPRSPRARSPNEGTLTRDARQLPVHLVRPPAAYPSARRCGSTCCGRASSTAPLCGASSEATSSTRSPGSRT